MAKRKKSKKKRRKIKKPRSILAMTAIFHCKGGAHKDKRDKRDKRDQLWKKDLKDS